MVSDGKPAGGSFTQKGSVQGFVFSLAQLALCQLKQASLIELLSTPSAEASPDLKPQFRRENAPLADLC